MSQRRTMMIAGHANLPQGMAAKSLFGTLAVVVEVDRKYGVIVSATCTLATEQAQDYMAAILVGSSLNDGIETLIEEIKDDYHGAAQNALIAALKDVHRTYLTLSK